MAESRSISLRQRGQINVAILAILVPLIIISGHILPIVESLEVLPNYFSKRNFNGDQASSLLDTYNSELRVYSHLGAELAWNMSIDLENGMKLLDKNEHLLIHKNFWNNEWCIKLLTHQHEFKSIEEFRQIYLICRGPRFSSYQVSTFLSILGTLRSVYDTTKICIEHDDAHADNNVQACYRMEPDLNHFMETSRNELKLREGWTKWHTAIGEQLSKPYFDLVKLMNVGARQAGHADIGACWREEMEMEHLIEKSLKLYHDVKYLYSLLHALVRYRLAEFYGLNLNGQPIPAHLLGNMWSQRWDSLIDIVWAKSESPEDKAMFIRKNIGPDATVADMVAFAENYYIKMGFPKLSSEFHANSYFSSNPNSTSKNCHGSAANMFNGNDYRIMMCAEIQDSDLGTIIHEMGHIHYFMAYKHQPTIFQDGANSAFHEALGDSTTYGMMSSPTMYSLLKLGLTKLPQIGFGLIVDLWRWKIFEANDEEAAGIEENVIESWNEVWWKLQHEFMGIGKPDGYKSNGLDALGKYHIVDNIPYIRYFHASFLQHMFYESMCPEGETYCKLDGRGGKLKKMMSEGSSKHWSIVLEELTGSSEVSSAPLLKYFKPLQLYLETQLNELGLQIGW